MRGTVLGPSGEDKVTVKWEFDPEHTWGMLPSSLRRADPKAKVRDSLTRIGPGRRPVRALRWAVGVGRAPDRDGPDQAQPRVSVPGSAKPKAFWTTFPYRNFGAGAQGDYQNKWSVGHHIWYGCCPR